MAAAVFFNSFTEDDSEKVHNLGTDTIMVMATNSAPVVTNTVKANITEISAGNGYTAGGFDTQNALSRTDDITTITAVNITVTASGGSIGPYRYLVAYNDTATNDELICYWDKGSSVTLNAGQTDFWDFGGAILTKTPT